MSGFHHALSLFLFLTSVWVVQAQEVNWMSFEHLPDSLRAEPKPVLVFIHADWCRYCRLQDQSTFVTAAVVQKLNQAYYCLRLDAEGEEAIEFMGRTYQFVPAGYETGQHELAQLLGAVDGQISLPTTLVLSKQLQLVRREASYLEAAFFLEWLE